LNTSVDREFGGGRRKGAIFLIVLHRIEIQPREVV